MAPPARKRPQEAKRKAPKERRPRIVYTLVDTSEGPEDLDAAAACIAAWLDTLPPR